jgi:hypothetical protein
VFAWWCLVLWTWLIRFFEVSVGVLWVLHPQWHQLPSWVSLLYLSHPCHLSLFRLTRGVTGRKSNANARWRKEDFTLPSFPPCACFYPIYLTLMKTPPTKNDEYWRSYTETTKEDDRLPNLGATFLFISLLLDSSFFESRDEIPFKGGRFVTPWNSQFQDVNRKNN